MSNSFRNDALETVQAMLHQETSYEAKDFLAACSAPLHEGLTSMEVDADCRNKMAAWCYQVADFCSFNRESVAIAMNLLDRFLCTLPGQVAVQDRSLFQLAAMTALYTSIKLNEPEAIDPATVSALSKGIYKPEEVEQMERHILTALQWRVHPPTSMSFVRSFLDLIPSDILSTEYRTAIHDIAKFQTELAVSKHEFIRVKASEVAYCSVVNAIEALNMNKEVYNRISSDMAQSMGLDSSETDLRRIQACLFAAVMQSDAVVSAETAVLATKTNASTEIKTATRRDSFDVSPRSAVHGC